VLNDWLPIVVGHLIESTFYKPLTDIYAYVD